MAKSAIWVPWRPYELIFLSEKWCLIENLPPTNPYSNSITQSPSYFLKLSFLSSLLEFFCSQFERERERET